MPDRPLMYERPKQSPRRHHDDPEVDEISALLVDAIDNDPEVRAAILRLFASQRTGAAPRPRRISTRDQRGR